jgi:nucleotide-binding universal stress UspA family protein
MRALIAIDGSAGADLAVQLAASLAWPANAELRLVSVLPEDRPPMTTHPGGSRSATVAEMDEGVVSTMDAILDDARARLQGAGTVATSVLYGRPAGVVAAEAEGWPADLVIMGSRGHGPIASLVMGSVSAEVVDHVHCPVLVARRPRADRILLATDGMDGSRAATSFLADWHPQRDGEVLVVSVAQFEAPLLAGIAPRMRVTSPTIYDEAREEARAIAARAADAACDLLAAAGIPAVSAVRDGHPSGEIVTAAREWPADLVVVGTRGHTGMARLILGSTARNVLVSAPCSVLVVKRPPTEGR